MVPPSSVRISRVPTYSSLSPSNDHSSTGLSPSTAGFSKPFSLIIILTITGLFPFRSPLLRKSRLISFPLGTEMFQFPRFALCTYVFSTQYSVNRVGFPIQISPDQCLLPTPRSFSQAATSFFAFYCLGIHRVRLFTWSYNPKSSLLSQSLAQSQSPIQLKCHTLLFHK